MLDPETENLLVWENADESTLQPNIQKDIMREDTSPETEAEEL